MNKYFSSLVVLSLSIGAFLLLSSNYFNPPTKVGLFVVVKPIQHQVHISSSSRAGLVGAAIAAGISQEVYAATGMGKYAKALLTAEPKMEVCERIKNLYQKVFARKGDELVVLDENAYKEKWDVYIHRLPTFNPPKGTGKKYFDKDIRFFKEMFDIDEVLIADVDYGIYSRYALGIETGRHGQASIHSVIINLDDNSIIHRGTSSERISIKGKWNVPPAYENVTAVIYLAMEEAIFKEGVKLERL